MSNTAIANGRTADLERYNSKFTPERVAIIVDHYRRGMSFQHCAFKAGIHPVTLHYWVAKGLAQQEGPYWELVLAMGKGLSDFEDTHVAELEAAAAGDDWRAALELLKRRLPRVWGDKAQIQVEQHLTELEQEQPVGGVDAASWGTPERVATLYQIASETGLTPEAFAGSTTAQPASSEPPATEVIVQRRHNPEQSGCEHVASNESRMRCGKCGVGVAYPLPEERAV